MTCAGKGLSWPPPDRAGLTLVGAVVTGLACEAIEPGLRATPTLLLAVASTSGLGILQGQDRNGHQDAAKVMQHGYVMIWLINRHQQQAPECSISDAACACHAPTDDDA